MAKRGDFNEFFPYITVAGCFLINLPFGIVWYYGNLSTYVDSYLLYQIGPAAFNVQPEWLISAYIVCYVVGVFTVDWLSGKFGSRLVEAAAALMFNGCTFLTYFSVQHSTAMILVTFMICTGYAAGLMNMITLVNIRNVMTKRVGLATALVSSAFGLGAIANNYVITAYINPRNLTPDVRQTQMAYFSQADVLDNVPGVFVVTGLISSGLNVIGYVLEHLPLLYLNVATKPQSAGTSVQKGASASEDINIVEVEDNASNGGVKAMETKHRISKDGENKEDAPSLKPFEIFWTRSLYLFWLSAIALTYGIVFTQNFYKLYGQLWIRNDAFLTSVGSFSAVSSALFRLLIGLTIDRIGVKYSVILTLSMNSTLFMFWYITPMLNNWLYFFCCQVLIGFQGTFFVLFPMATLKFYGPTYYATNFGIILLANMGTDLAAPLLFSYLRNEYGWLSMVMLGSLFSTLTLVLVTILLPHDKGVRK